MPDLPPWPLRRLRDDRVDVCAVVHGVGVCEGVRMTTDELYTQAANPPNCQTLTVDEPRIFVRFPPTKRKPMSREAIIMRASKVSAAKLAKRIDKTCPVCNEQFRVKPSQNWRICCSIKCKAKLSTTARMRPCPRCGVLSMRRPSSSHLICLSCVKIVISERNKRTGNNPIAASTKESEERRLASLRSADNRNRVSLQFKDKHPQHPLLKQYSPDHVSAVEGYVRDPNGIIHHVINISRFVHDNKNLFASADVEQKNYGGKTSKSYQCHATQGLSTIIRGHRGRWKQWTPA